LPAKVADWTSHIVKTSIERLVELKVPYKFIGKGSPRGDIWIRIGSFFHLSFLSFPCQ